jgi:hypothetical protein
MNLSQTLKEDEIFNEVNRKIASITLEEYLQIEKEVQPEIEDTERRIARMKRGEYF